MDLFVGARYGITVTPGFKNKTECITICMSVGSVSLPRPSRTRAQVRPGRARRRVPGLKRDGEREKGFAFSFEIDSNKFNSNSNSREFKLKLSNKQ